MVDINKKKRPICDGATNRHGNILNYRACIQLMAAFLKVCQDQTSRTMSLLDVSRHYFLMSCTTSSSLTVCPMPTRCGEYLVDVPHTRAYFSWATSER